MRRSPTPLKQPGCTEKKSASAYGGYILCLTSLAANEDDRLDISEGVYNAKTPRNTNQVERWRAVESARRHETQTAVTRNRSQGLRDNVNSRFRKLAGNGDRWRRSEPAQNLEWAGEVELCDPGED